jgi:Major Facilitator Superfamily
MQFFLNVLFVSCELWLADRENGKYVEKEIFGFPRLKYTTHGTCIPFWNVQNVLKLVEVMKARVRNTRPRSDISSISSRSSYPSSAFGGFDSLLMGDNLNNNNSVKFSSNVNNGESKSSVQNSLTSNHSNLPYVTCAILASVTTGGSTYGFSLYANALKHSLHLSQGELTTISAATFSAGLFSWGPGLRVDWFGVRNALISGGCGSASMLLFFWAVSNQRIEIPREYLILTLSCLGVGMCLAVALVTGSVFKIIVTTCGPGSKGATVGAAKGYVGLGAGAYAALFSSLGRENDLDCLIMIAGFNFLAASVPAWLLLSPQSMLQDEYWVDDVGVAHFRTLYVGLAGLGILVVGQSLMVLIQGAEGSLIPDYAQFFLILFVWVIPILSLLIHPRASNSSPSHGVDEETPLVNTGSSTVMNKECELILKNGGSNTPPVPSLELSPSKDMIKKSFVEGKLSKESPSLSAPTPDIRQYTLLQMLSTWEAWLLCWTCTILTGGGTLMTSNMGQMVESLKLHNSVTGAALAFFCAAQALSRVVTGILSDFCWKSYEWPRPVFLVVASFAGLAAHLLLAFSTEESTFVIGVALSGVAFGMVWPLVVLVVGELFGTENLGANYMFYDGFDTAIGTLLISKWIATEVYDSHIPRQDNSDLQTCYGTNCFCMTHYIVAALSLSCVFTAICLLHTKHCKSTYSGGPNIAKLH